MTFAEIVRRCEEVLRQVQPHVTVLAATKDRGPEEVRAASLAGINHIGENYVQEAERKRALVTEPAVWHMIGHLQKNKAKKAARVFDWVETVDSVELARRLELALAVQERVLNVLIQVNIGREPHKAGAHPEDVLTLAQEIRKLPHLVLRGLMATPPPGEGPEDSRPHFRAMRRLFEDLRMRLPTPYTRSDTTEFNVLSMGMSADWEVAVEEGATLIRLGTALFGPLPPAL